MLLDGVGEYFDIASTPIALASYPVTMSCWFKTSDTTTTMTVMCIGADAANRQIALECFAGEIVALSNAGGAPFRAVATASYSAATWTHGLAVFLSTTSRTIYMNGSNNATDTNSSNPTGAGSYSIGCELANNTAGAFFNGDVAEAAMWNVALDAAEINALADGIAPSLVRPGSRVVYAPLFRSGAINLDGTALTVNSTPVASGHPRIIQARNYLVGAPSAAAAAGQPFRRRFGGVPHAHRLAGVW